MRKDVSIPSSVNGYTITRIGDNAFNNKGLTSVTLPGSVIIIGHGAFARNQLGSVAIPNSVANIYNSAFYNNNLTSVTLPSSVTSIGGSAFERNRLTSVTLPSSMTSIGEQAFADNPGLVTLVSNRTVPPSIHTNSFINANRIQIDLVVPTGKKQDYESAGWAGFKSIREPAPFTTTWKVGEIDYGDGDLTVTIPIINTYTYNFTVDWGDGMTTAIAMNNPNNAALTHTYANAGTYDVRIYGDFPALYFNNAGDKDKILTVKQWGDIEWHFVARAFQGCTNLDITATDVPNLSDNVTSMNGMFDGAQSLVGNEHFNRWDVSKVTDMGGMFQNATNFDGNISGWTVSKVTNMGFMFNGATKFNQNIGNWTVSNVTNMRDMFNGATNFNQDISGWNVSNVTNMSFMLSYSGLSRGYYGATLKYWADLDNTPTGITLGAHDLVYDCDEEAHRQTLMDTYGWEFAGDAKGDDQAPVLNLTTQQLRLYLDMGMATLSLDQLAYSAEDNCSEESELVYSFDAPNSNVTTREFGLDDRGEQTVTLFVSDPYGNAASKDLIVTVINTATDILSFTIPGQSGETVIDYDNHTVVIEVELGRDLSGLTPTIALSDGASANPESGVARDFTDQVSYTVTAEDGSTQQVWRVTVEAAGNGERKPLADFNRGFSPNGDGIADTLVIQGLEKYQNNVVKIYNLSQRLVFSAHYRGPGNAWDCTHKGSLVPVGSYLCVIDFNDPGLGQKAKMIYVNY